MRRFGRNQKRKAKEKIAELEKYISNSQLSLQRLNDDHDDLVAVYRKMSFQLAEIEMTIDPMSSLLEPKEKVNYGNGLQSYILARESQDAIGHYKISDGILNLPPHIKLKHLTTESYKILNQSIHFRVKFGDDELGYAFSSEMLEITPKEVLAERISRELTMQILKNLEKI